MKTIDESVKMQLEVAKTMIKKKKAKFFSNDILDPLQLASIDWVRYA